MHSEPDDCEDELDIDEDESVEEDEFVEDSGNEETIVMTETESSDNIGDVSVEINVEELVAQVEAEQPDDAAKKAEVRRRLEDVYEDKDVEDTYAIEFSKD